MSKTAAGFLDAQAEAVRALGAPDNLLTSSGLKTVLGGISEMTLWRWTRCQGFPPPDFVISRRKFWRRSTIERWIAAQADKTGTNDEWP